MSGGGKERKGEFKAAGKGKKESGRLYILYLSMCVRSFPTPGEIFYVHQNRRSG